MLNYDAIIKRNTESQLDFFLLEAAVSLKSFGDSEVASKVVF